MGTDRHISAVEADLPGRVPGDPPRVDKAHAERTAQLFEAEYDRLVHYLVARTRSWDEARDVASQAFAQVLQVDSPHAVSFLRGYVYRAAKNIWTNRTTSRSLRRRVDPVALYHLVTESPSPEPLLLQQQRDRILQRAIQGLRPSRKLVLIWRLWDDLTYREIALRLEAQEQIRVDERTVSNWFTEALQELAAAVGVEAEADDLQGEDLA